MGLSQSNQRLPGGILLDTNLLVYYQLPIQVAVEEQDKILSKIVTLIIDNIDKCGPLIIFDTLFDEMKNALRDKLIEKGISKRTKMESASKLIDDFRIFLENFSSMGLAVYIEEGGLLYRKAHWIYKKIKRISNKCVERIPKKVLDRMTRDSILLAVADSLGATLVTRDVFLHKVSVCLYSQSNIKYSSILIYLESNKKEIYIELCTRLERSCIINSIQEAANDLGWRVNIMEICSSV
jgi:hypothetical protein